MTVNLAFIIGMITGGVCTIMGFIVGRWSVQDDQ
jgi:hypothetical protein